MKKIIVTIAALLIFSFGLSEGTFAASVYKVKSGDSLSKISKKYHVSISHLKQWNHLNSDMIKVNQLIKLYPSASSSSSSSQSSPKESFRYITVNSTAYTASCKGCSGVTSTGFNLLKHPNAKVISVDPKIIPLGSKVYVPGYGLAIAGDKGCAIKGKKIDLFISSRSKALQWGARTVTIKVYN
ncbi:3D domain-containing protein [Heyndrickxia acidicola]|uniref:3D domain-containing protein n=1 Tax=Heyndrickxia acidicola TaxID=209389 RepID=A0ABU6MGJ1_9BACI|nr:3D domain-containing protein [Heyndrickxia acidicola]MED1202155.1 3D domain-containing protein [Heyndrickxia acidicola]